MRRAVLAARSALRSCNILAAQGKSYLATSSRLYSGETITCTLFPGDGIGPEIAESVKKIYEAAGAPIDWDEQYIGKVADPRTNSMVTRENLDSVLVRRPSSATPALINCTKAWAYRVVTF
jgi:isocitrate dehydrogenase (NAD+)